MSEKPRVILSEAPIVPGNTRFLPDEGAEAQFLGVVREDEAGTRLAGIEYSAFESMARKVLEELLNEAASAFGPHRVVIQHRLGFVPVGLPSILIQVCTKHSKEAFDLCYWYLKRIKSSVPIWKKPVPA